MKTLENYCKKNGLDYQVITYKAQGQKVRRKGYDLLKNGRFIVALEPVQYKFYPEKYLIRFAPLGYSGPLRLTRITENSLNQIFETI
jgi:hypothetical protein